MRRVKQQDDNQGLYRKKDKHSARLKECDEIIDVRKYLNVQQVNKPVSTSRLKRSTADQSPYDAKSVAYCQNDNESSFKADEVRLEIERLKEIVEKWKNKYRSLNCFYTHIQRENKPIRKPQT